MKPVVNKDNTYDRFIENNRWVIKIFPNAQKYYVRRNRKRSENIRKNLIGDIVEKMVGKLQLYFINRHKTSELITPTQLWFFPHDFESKLKRSKNGKIKSYLKGVPTILKK